MPTGSSIVRKVIAFLRHGPVIASSTARKATTNETAVSSVNSVFIFPPSHSPGVFCIRFICKSMQLVPPTACFYWCSYSVLLASKYMDGYIFGGNYYARTGVVGFYDQCERRRQRRQRHGRHQVCSRRQQLVTLRRQQQQRLKQRPPLVLRPPRLDLLQQCRRHRRRHQQRQHQR